MKNIEKKAIDFCKENNQRLTEPRIKVLKIIASSEKPIKAYDILKKLSLVIKNPKPPTAYRAIDFWESHDFIHRIESLNAYSLCVAEHLHKGSQFMICTDCGKVIESHFCELPDNIKKSVESNIFTATKWNLEIKGLCSKCS
jgi:Fur family zinc uptake transcriptional regulator